LAQARVARKVRHETLFFEGNLGEAFVEFGKVFIAFEIGLWKGEIAIVVGHEWRLTCP
jgi:hypothetical protein